MHLSGPYSCTKFSKIIKIYVCLLCVFDVSPGPLWEFHLVKILNLEVYQVQQQGKVEKCLEEDNVLEFGKDWAKNQMEINSQYLSSIKSKRSALLTKHVWGFERHNVEIKQTFHTYILIWLIDIDEIDGILTFLFV